MDAEAQIIEQLQQQNKLLVQMLGHQRRHTALLTQMVNAMQETDPNYRRPLSQYRQFDWESIGATVMAHDEGGPTVIEWGGGHQWLRRNAQDRKFGKAVWYSRHASGSGDNAQYYTLIKFVQKMEVEAMTVDLPPQQPTPKPATAVAKDWRADACSSVDSFVFDTAYLRHQFSYFKRTDVVMAAREVICGAWPDKPDDGYATAVCAALDFYVDGVRAKGNGGDLDKKALVAEAQQKFMEAANDSSD